MTRFLAVGTTVCLISCATSTADAQENCETALTRIGRRAVDNAVRDHRDDACPGLRTTIAGVMIGIDDTKQLELRAYRLCEAGPNVTASITVHVQCSSGSGALVPASLSDDLTATASADLDACRITDLKVTGGSRIVQAGLDLANVDRKLREAAQQQISAFCR